MSRSVPLLSRLAPKQARAVGLGEPGAAWTARYADQPMTFTRITINPDQMGGAACIRALRIPVATVVGMLADGMAAEEILDAYPDLEPDDLSEALRYAA